MKNNLGTLLLTGSLFTTAITSVHAQALISGFMSNPAGTDSPFEYVQFVATTNINFALKPMSVVFATDGTATSSGWVAGGTVTYEMSLTSGSVTAGQTFYIGGSGKLINGSGSTDISGLNWIRTLNTGTTGGDLFGTAASAGVVGNGGSSADGIAIFNGITLTAASVPVDAVFYGSTVGGAFVGASSGYTLPSNDVYSGGYLANNSTLFSDPAGSQYVALSGTYNTNTGAWIVDRTSSLVTLTSSSPASSIATQITLVPEPSTFALGGTGLVALLGLARRNRKK